MRFYITDTRLMCRCCPRTTYTLYLNLRTDTVTSLLSAVSITRTVDKRKWPVQACDCDFASRRQTFILSALRDPHENARIAASFQKSLKKPHHASEEKNQTSHYPHRAGFLPAFDKRQSRPGKLFPGNGCFYLPRDVPSSPFFLRRRRKTSPPIRSNITVTDLARRCRTVRVLLRLDGQ